MNLSIIIIGDEILLGQVNDTNSGAIARTFSQMGWTVDRIFTVHDIGPEIKSAVRTALLTSDLVITTGGLGPTKDDITKLTLMEIFGGTLYRDEGVTENIIRVFAERGLELNQLTLDQALVPDTCKVIPNRLGTAPVMWFEMGTRVLVAMPGVPFETEGALTEVAEQVRSHFTPDITLLHHTLMVGGITESDLAAKLAGYEASLPEDLHLAYLPSPGMIRLRLDGYGRKGIDRSFNAAVEKLRAELSDLLLYDGDSTPAEMVIEKLRELNMTVATAESCTGGNIARSITAVAGASDVYPGSVVSYANSVKEGLLGVSPHDLEEHGAVSREVVEQMARGACEALAADCAVATSGIAGPGGGTPDKPVGTVWIAWCVKGTVTSKVFHFPGKRGRVIERATAEALLGLYKQLQTI